MSKSIFEPSVVENLSSVFSEMTTQTQPTKTKPSKRVVRESVESNKGVTPAVATIVKEKSVKTLSSFNAVFNAVIGESDEFDDIDMDVDVDVEDGVGEGEMVEIPRALLDELITYLEDPMGDDEESDVDDFDMDLPEEKIQVSKLTTKGGSTVSGSVIANDNTKQSAKKSGSACGKKVRDGKASLLNRLYSFKVSGSPTAKVKMVVGQKALVK